MKSPRCVYHPRDLRLNISPLYIVKGALINVPIYLNYFDTRERTVAPEKKLEMKKRKREKEREKIKLSSCSLCKMF